jgi:purine-binding chemotaxis protein CheW
MEYDDEQPQDIDWDAVRAELQWDNSRYTEAAEQSRLILRAQQYASAKGSEYIDTQTLLVLTFDLGGERYGVDVMLVRGLRDLPHVTHVPGSPRFYTGVVNLRGQIITVMDLRPFFDMPVNDSEPPSELVVVKSGRLELALLAHHIHGVQSIPQADVVSAGEIRYTRGVTANRLVLLDIAALFEDERLIAGGPEE